MSGALVVALVAGIVLPAGTAFLARETTGRWRAVITATLAVMTAALTTVVFTPPKSERAWEELVTVLTVSWVVATVADFFAWRPSGASKVIARKSISFIPPRKGSKP